MSQCISVKFSPKNPSLLPTQCCTTKAVKMPASPYKGNGYRSIAFGTWAVGDAARCFGDRKRGKSATALESDRIGRKAMEENGTKKKKRKTKMKKRERRSSSSSIVRSTGDNCNPRSSSSSSSSSPPSHPLPQSSSASSSSSSSSSSNDNRRTTLSLSLGDISHQIGGKDQTMKPKMKESDLYSSTEYVRHTNGGAEIAVGARINCEKIPPTSSIIPSGPMCPPCFDSSSNNIRSSLDMLYPPPPSIACPSPLSCRTSCPPIHLRHRQFYHHRPSPAPPSHQPFAFIIDPLAKGMPRTRTKSLDNGLKPSLNTVRYRKGHGPIEGTNDVPCSARSVATTAGCIEQQRDCPIGTESRLENAKNFLRRFYVQSTLRLTGKRRRKRVMDSSTKSGESCRGSGVGTGGGGDSGERTPVMYSSAMGPFFEMRKPQPEEVPFLPYNIHYAIESSDESEKEQADGRTEPQEVHAHHRSPPSRDWSCTPTPSSAATATITGSGTPLMVTTPQIPRRTADPMIGNQCPIGVDSPRNAPFVVPAISCSAPQCSLLPTTPSSPAPPSASSSSPSTSSSATISASPNQQKLDHHLPPTTETTPTTPSAGYGSLKSASDSEGREREQRREGGGQSGRAQEMGAAERRFADWNELFQYLKREIMEMNVRDAQILCRLEGIQQELNGVRRMSTQQQQQRR